MGKFRHLLCQVALAEGATVRSGTQVAYIDTLRGAITLESGEVIHGDVIIGADGGSGISRQLLLNETDSLDLPGPSGPQFSMYRYAIRRYHEAV